MSLPTNPLNRKEQYLNAIATGNTVDMPAKPITREEEYLDAIAKRGGGGGGTTNYNALDNKPQIAGTTLQGNKTLADLGIAGEDAIEDVYAVMGEMGAKNLIPYPYANTTKTENNVTFNDNGDGTITIVTGTGGVTANTFFSLTSNAWRFTLHKGSYILSDTTIAEEGLGVQIYQRTSPYTNIADTILGDNLFTISEDIEVMMRITVKQGINVDNVIIKPMLRLASDTDDTYQSYAKTNKQLTDEIANKVDKVEGKGLSTNDYSDTEKGKVTANAEAIEAITEVYGGKNLLPNAKNIQTINDVSFTPNDDGSIVINGTNSGDELLYDISRSYFLLEAGEYIISDGVYDTSTHFLQITDITSTINHHSAYGPTKFTVNTPTLFTAYIVVGVGVSVDGICYPMIRDARIDDDTYVPYTMTNKELTEVTNALPAMQNVLGAKNLLSYPYFGTTKTENGVTFTDNGDGTISVSTVAGGASADTYFTIRGWDAKLNNGNYILSGCPAGGSYFDTYGMYIGGISTSGTEQVLGYDSGEGADFTINGSSDSPNYSKIRSIFIVRQGVVLTTPLTVKPMIRPAGTDATYVPYAMTNKELTNAIQGISGGSEDYSTIEKVVGTWIDGSLVYQKTFDVSFALPNSWTWVSTGIVPSDYNIDKIISANHYSSTYNTAICAQLTGVIDGYIKVFGYGGTTVSHTTLRYTKTT